MPKNLFKYIIHKKYKDVIPLLLFSNKIEVLFNKNKISEEEKLNSIQLFNQKNNLWLKNFKISNEDMLRLTELFSKKINIWLKKSEISEENVLDLIDLFKEKMKISDEVEKVITVAGLLKDAENLESINKLLDEFPPRYFSVDDWEEINNEDIENECDVIITRNNNLNKEETLPISVFSEQNDDSGIYLDSSSELMQSSITLGL